MVDGPKVGRGSNIVILFVSDSFMPLSLTGETALYRSWLFMPQFLLFRLKWCYNWWCVGGVSYACYI